MATGNWLTVAELIEHLKTMPPDAVCIYSAGSEYHSLEAGDVKSVTAEAQAAEAKLRREFDDIIIKHNGMYMRYDPKRWPEGSTPEFVAVCKFPGG